MKVLDPVCQMTIDDKDAEATSVYKDRTYYFCSKSCKQRFDQNAESFLSEKKGASD